MSNYEELTSGSLASFCFVDDDTSSISFASPVPVSYGNDYEGSIDRRKRQPYTPHHCDSAHDEEIGAICSTIFKLRFRNSQKSGAASSGARISKRNRPFSQHHHHQFHSGGGGLLARRKKKLPSMSINISEAVCEVDDSYLPPRLEMKSACGSFFEEPPAWLQTSTEPEHVPPFGSFDLAPLLNTRGLSRADSSSTCASSTTSPSQSPADI